MKRSTHVASSSSTSSSVRSLPLRGSCDWDVEVVRVESIVIDDYLLKYARVIASVDTLYDGALLLRVFTVFANAISFSPHNSAESETNSASCLSFGCFVLLHGGNLVIGSQSHYVSQ